MKRWFFIVVFATFLPVLSSGQVKEESPDPSYRMRGYYITAQFIKRSAFPLSFTDETWSEATEANSSFPSLSIGLGGSTDLGKSFYGGIELEFAMSNFSDYRVSSRNVYFIDLVLDIGLLIPVPDVPAAVYGIAGFGYYLQSGYDEDWMGEAYLEYLSKSNETFIYGFGMKLKPLKQIALVFDYRFLRNLYLSGTGEEVPDMPGWQYAERESESLGKRVSFGISYYIQ